MSRPIYGIGTKNDNLTQGCCPDFLAIDSFVRRNTEILNQLESTKKKDIALQRLNVLIVEIQSSLTSLNTTGSMTIAREIRSLK